jgi:hypothetical protein
MEEINENGYPELVIQEDCDFNSFYQIAEQLRTELEISFLERLDDFDTVYWPFVYRCGYYVLHYNVYTGVSIYPQNTTRATESEKAFLTDFDIRWYS